jgi:membrane protein YdbS with pleckstrin-like domain
MEEDDKDLKYYPDKQRLYGAWRFIIRIFFGVVAVITAPFVVLALCGIGGPDIAAAALGLFFGAFLPYTVFSMFFCMWARAFVRTIEYTVTDKAVIIKQGVFWRIEKSIPFHKVTDALTIQGPVARLYGFGNAGVQTAGKGQGIEGTLRGLVNYKDVRDVILERVTALQKQDRFGE